MNTVTSTLVPGPPPTLDTIQIGMEWVSETAGGLNRYFSELVRELPRVGVRVRGLVVGSDSVGTHSAGAVTPFAPHRASLPARLAGVRALARAAYRQEPGSLLVSHFALYAAPCLDLRRGRPLVVHFQGPWSAESRVEGANRVAVRLKHFTEARVYRSARRLIVLSHAFGQLLEREYGVEGHRIRVIPGGTDTGRFRPGVSRAEARQMLGWPRDRPVVFVVRRLVRRMGLENLVQAVRDARQALPDLLVMIGGRGPLRGELQQLIDVEGVADHVRLIGFVPDEALPTAYRAADLSLVPSVAVEGFGLVVVESLAAGTPVIVTAVGGLPETVSALAPQCIVRDPGAPALAAAMVDALRGHVPLPGAEACMHHARACFDWSVVASRVRAAYLEAVQ